MKKLLLLLLLSINSIDAGIIGRTPVHTKHPLAWPNKVNVEDLQVGDEIFTIRCKKRGDSKSDAIYKQAKILKITKKKIRDVIFIRTESGQLIVDPDEMFFNPKIMAWRPAYNLTTQDVLMGVQLGHLRIKSVEHIILKKAVNVYDLNLTNPHMFFICDSMGNSIMVHNEPLTLMAIYLASLSTQAAIGASIPVITAGTGTFATAAGLSSVLTLATAAPIIVVAPFVLVGAAGVFAVKGIISFFHHREHLKRIERDQHSISPVTASAAPDLSAPASAAPVTETINVTLTEDMREIFESIKKANNVIEKVKITTGSNNTRVGNTRVNNNNSQGPMGPEEEERKLQAIGYQGSEKNSRQISKSYHKYKAKFDDHVDKLQKYILEPMKYDNRGHLANAQNQEIKASIIKTRVNHLCNEINGFAKNANSCLDALRELGKEI